MSRAFSLIQISILLTLASLVLVAILPSGQNKVVSNGATEAQLNSILVYLRQYQATYGTLPCPADATQPIGSANYGIAAANPGTTNNCTGGTPAANYADAANNIAIGMLPVKTLSIAGTYATDAFGRDNHLCGGYQCHLMLAVQFAAGPDYR